MKNARVALGAVSFLAVLFGAPWVAIVGAGILAVRWHAWEVLLLGFFVDVLYVPLAGVWGFPFPTTLVALLLVWSLAPFRQQLYK